MNVVNLIATELNKKSWDILEQIRYVYNRTCSLFVYDERYHYADYKLKQEILKKKIDLENVIDKRVVCTSWSSQVFAPLMKEFFNIETISTNDGKHESALFWYDNQMFLADANLDGDISRVKFNFSTNGLYPLGNAFEFNETLRKKDQKIGYIKDFYNDEMLSIYIAKFNNFYKHQLESKLIISEEFINIRMNKILELWKLANVKQGYFDARFFFEYLLIKFFSFEERENILRFTYVDNENNFNIKDVYMIKNISDKYVLQKEEDGYTVKKSFGDSFKMGYSVEVKKF